MSKDWKQCCFIGYLGTNLGTKLILLSVKAYIYRYIRINTVALTSTTIHFNPLQ